MHLDGKVAVVTGAACGIGRVLALGLAARGAKLVLTGLEQEELDELRKEIEAKGGSAIASACDVRDQAGFERIVSDALEIFGQLDILINNAGIMLGGDIGLISEEEWDRVLGVNLRGPIRTVRVVLPHMLERGSGYIVNIASGAGLVAPSHWIPYATSKFALIGYSEGLAAALRSKGIGVSVVCPMQVQTSMIETPTRKSAAAGARDASSKDPIAEYWWNRFIKWITSRPMTPSKAAHRIIRGLERERFLVYTHQSMRLIVLARAIAPELFSHLWSRVSALDERRRQSNSSG